MFDLEEELKKIPEKPGVYLMFGQYDEIIYIGKAKILKNRVRQYFQSSNKNSPKVFSLSKKIQKFEYIVTENEMEALILENNLIKKYEPKYNIRLKDDKTYPYLKLTTNEMFPRLIITRKRENDKAKYFGPFTSASLLKENLELIQNIVPLRRCSKKFPRDLGKDRPCLNYHIGNCKAPCNYLITEEEYSKMVKTVLDFFNGNHNKIIKDLEKEMLEASENLEFEKAQILRDKIYSIKKLGESQFVENIGVEDCDVISFARANSEAMFQIFFIRGGKITGKENSLFNNVEHFTRSRLIEEFVKQFYSGTVFVPKEILLQEEIEDKKVVEEWLTSIKGQKVFINTPRKGEKLKLIQLASKNAILTLDKFGEQMKREHQKTVGAIEELRKALNINTYLERIEAYDISNTSGIQSVGAMVVFENGKPKKTDYRKFKIKTVVGADDYSSIKEVIERRFKRYLKEIKENDKNKKFNKLPNIIFLDGGKGQVNIVLETLEKLNLNIMVCGMVKDDFHRTRGIIFNNREIDLKKFQEGFKLLTRIQDEVHRFAIEYHRKARDKEFISSILDEIEGIGNKRKKELLKHFGSIDFIRNAGIEELSKVESMNLKSAEKVYNFFRNIKN